MPSRCPGTSRRVKTAGAAVSVTAMSLAAWSASHRLFGTRRYETIWLPGETYRCIWERLDRELDPRAACKTIVGLLSLANRANCEKELGDYVLDKNDGRSHPDASCA